MSTPQTPSAFGLLHGHTYARLTTLRKNGTPVVTPVWFAQEGDRVYVVTRADAGKVKRIRNNPQVLLAPCTAAGKVLAPAVSGTARVLPPTEWEAARQALDRKYGWRKRVLDLLYRSRGGGRAYLEIVPAWGPANGRYSAPPA